MLVYDIQKVKNENKRRGQFMQTVRHAVVTGTSKRFSDEYGQAVSVSHIKRDNGATQIILGKRLRSITILSVDKEMAFTLMFSARNLVEEYEAALCYADIYNDLDMQDVCLVRIPPTRDISTMLDDAYKLYRLFAGWDSVEDFEEDQNVVTLDYMRVKHV